MINLVGLRSSVGQLLNRADFVVGTEN